MKKKYEENSGTTLVELMIYMIVALIVITAAFKVISSAANGYTHGRTIAKAQYNARDGLTAISRDIASMGYKSYFWYGADGKCTTNVDYVGSTDNAQVVGGGRETLDPNGNTAAFFFADEGSDDMKSDTLEFFRIRVNEKGERIARERVKYFLDKDNKVIIRMLWTMKQTGSSLIFDEWGDPDTTRIASNVVALNFRFSKNGIDWISEFDTATKRSDIRNVEIVILVKGYKKEKGEYGHPNYLVGDKNYLTPEADKGFIHRLYRQVVEVPNNAKGNK